MTREFTGRDMAFLMISFFAVVVSVNVAMAVISSESWTGLIVPNSYVASQRFNATTAALEHSAQMNVHATIIYEKGKVTVLIHNAAGDAIRAVAVTLKIGRPSHESEDRTLELLCLSDGKCSGESKLDPGIWSGEVHAELGGSLRWSRAVRFLVKEG